MREEVHICVNYYFFSYGRETLVVGRLGACSVARRFRVSLGKSRNCPVPAFWCDAWDMVPVLLQQLNETTHVNHLALAHSSEMFLLLEHSLEQGCGGARLCAAGCLAAFLVSPH